MVRTSDGSSIGASAAWSAASEKKRRRREEKRRARKGVEGARDGREGSVGRDAHRWEAISHVRPRAPVAARARGSCPPRRRTASARARRRQPSRRPFDFHPDLMSLRCRHVHEGLPATPFAFAFGPFDRFAPASAMCVGSTRRRSCAARVRSRADVCAARGRARATRGVEWVWGNKKIWRERKKVACFRLFASESSKLGPVWVVVTRTSSKVSVWAFSHAPSFFSV
jgi:hypothetical protein